MEETAGAILDFGLAQLAIEELAAAVRELYLKGRASTQQREALYGQYLKELSQITIKLLMDFNHSPSEAYNAIPRIEVRLALLNNRDFRSQPECDDALNLALRKAQLAKERLRPD